MRTSRLAVLAVWALVTSQAALGATYTVAWNSASANMCPVCSTNLYACSTGSPAPITPRTFTDATPVTARVTTVSVTMNNVPCAAGTVAIAINGVAIGAAQSVNGLCSSCSGNPCAMGPTFTLTDANGIPGWNYGGTNTITVTPSAWFCVVSATITTTETALPPGLYVTPTSGTFGNQRVGTTSAPITLQARNASMSPVTISGVTPTGPFASPTSLPVVIPAGAQTSLTATFTPVALGAASGQLSFTSTATNSPSVVTFSGTGTQPAASATPTTVAFGDQNVGSQSANTTITISNTGSAPLTITALPVVGPFIASALSLPYTVPAGGTAQFFIRFAPMAPGPAAGTVTVACDAPTQPVVTLTGNGTQPALTASPATLAFGDQSVGVQSAPLTLQLTNTGTGPVTISTWNYNGPIFVTGFSAPSTLAPGASVSLQVRFTPTVTGAATGQLRFISNAPTSPTLVDVTGNGIQPSVVVAPSMLSFPNTRLGSSDTLTLSLQSTGTGPLTVASVGPVSGQHFSLVSPPVFPVQVASGSSLTLTVRFQPSSVGLKTDTLGVTTNASTNPFVTVALSGLAVAPNAVITPNPVLFGNVAIGSSSTLPLTVSNTTGTASLTISALTLGGTAVAEYSTTTTAPVVVAAGAMTTIPIRFAPTMFGPRTASLTIVSDDPIQPSRVVNLAGVGTAPVAAVNPAQYDFGDVLVGQTRTTIFTVSNAGTAPLTVSGLALGGADPLAFSLTAPVTPLTLAPGTSVQVTVGFGPTMLGARAAQLEVTSNDPSSPVRTAAVTATGTAPQATVTPTSLDFGKQLPGRTSFPRTVDVANPGSAPYDVTQVSVTGASAPMFTVTGVPTLPATVAPGGHLLLEVTTLAPVLGPRQATLVLQTTDPVAPMLTVPLSTLASTTLLTVTPNPLDFGAQPVGGSTTRDVTLTNECGDALDVLDGTLTGAGAAAYAVPAIAGTLASGASTTITVTFSPGTTGTHDAVLRLAAVEPAVTPAVVALTGSGSMSVGGGGGSGATGGGSGGGVTGGGGGGGAGGGATAGGSGGAGGGSGATGGGGATGGAGATGGGSAAGGGEATGGGGGQTPGGCGCSGGGGSEAVLFALLAFAARRRARVTSREAV